MRTQPRTLVSATSSALKSRLSLVGGSTLVCLLTGAALLLTTAWLVPTGKAVAETPASGTVAPKGTVATEGTVVPTSDPSATQTPRDRPNIVLITTDDMTDYELRWMPYTRRLVGGQGVNLRGFISPHPLCCPARAEILTGQYGHNNGVHHNKGLLGGYQAFDTQHHVARWLRRAGYRTAFVGKFMNGYEDVMDRVPGWDVFAPSVRRIYRPYGVTLLENGELRRYRKLYTADLVSRKTTQYIKRFSRRDEPFFIWSSQLAPHQMRRRGWVPPVPADRHRDLFPKATAPSVSDPAFAEKDVSDKPAYVREHTPVSVRKANRVFRQRIRSLQAVDEAVRDTVRALKDAGELRNTLVVFTSDNGFLVGEHRLFGKNMPYEQALRVPMLVRGPGVPKGVTRNQTMLMVDLAPTFLDLAGASADVIVDGRSLLPVLRRNATGYSTSLIQGGHARQPWFFRGVRTRRYTYVSYLDGFEELYDRRRDPAQMRNVVARPRYGEVLMELRRRTATLSACAGETCRQDLTGGLDLATASSVG